MNFNAWSRSSCGSRVTYTDHCVTVNYQNWIALHELSVYRLNTFGMQRESSSPSSASDWSLTDINHGFLECLGMLGNVRAVESGSGIPSFAASPETRPPQINQISTAEVETFVCDWQISVGGGVKWGGTDEEEREHTQLQWGQKPPNSCWHIHTVHTQCTYSFSCVLVSKHIP